MNPIAHSSIRSLQQSSIDRFEICNSYFASLRDEAANRSLPSGNLTWNALPTGPPARARNPLIVTSVPGVMSSLDQPALSSAFGAPISNRHDTVLPPGSFTSIWSQACGFDHSSFVIVPDILIGLD